MSGQARLKNCHEDIIVRLNKLTFYRRFFLAPKIRVNPLVWVIEYERITQ